MAIGWLGGKVDHPMADAKRARELIDALPSNDPPKALEEITYWLESINQTGEFKLNQRFENIDLLDGAARSHVRKLSRDYLSMPRQMKFQENRLWNAIFGVWRQLGDGYLHCAKQYDDGLTGMTLIRKSLPVIVARVIRALTFQLKWRLLRYGPVERRIWAELAQAYAIAEQRGFADGAIALYPGAQGESTVRREFLTAMMLSASSPEGLPPLRQEIADRMAAYLAGTFRISGKPDGCTHYVDLASPGPAVRLFKGVEPNSTLRFFGAGRGLVLLNQLIGKVQQSGVMPQGVNLGGNYGKDDLVGTFRHLAQYWSEQPPARTSERRPSAGRITVVPGLKDVLKALDPSGDDTLDFSLGRPGGSGESWIVEDVSDGGYGAVIPTVKSDWIRVGTLVGLQSETSRAWGIGLIRRIVRDEQQQRHVGIQVLTRTAVPVSLSLAQTLSFTASDRDAERAILLPTGPDARGEVGIVMRSGRFNGRDSLDMMTSEKTYRLTPVGLVEGGEDFDWVRFKIMQHSA
ncbi:MAG: hypothetical protein ACREUB_01225 [Burkholderiales bacterium]